VHYLHSQGVVHRDLKLENILLKRTEDSYEVKIADFGLSALVRIGEDGYHNSKRIQNNILSSEDLDKSEAEEFSLKSIEIGTNPETKLGSKTNSELFMNIYHHSNAKSLRKKVDSLIRAYVECDWADTVCNQKG
ncbi:unnamed protein product, partial [Sphagnum jensenii]